MAFPCKGHPGICNGLGQFVLKTRHQAPSCWATCDHSHGSWLHIAVDIVTGLPPSAGNTTILTIIVVFTHSLTANLKGLTSSWKPCCGALPLPTSSPRVSIWPGWSMPTTLAPRRPQGSLPLRHRWDNKPHSFPSQRVSLQSHQCNITRVIAGKHGGLLGQHCLGQQSRTRDCRAIIVF